VAITLIISTSYRTKLRGGGALDPGVLDEVGRYPGHWASDLEESFSLARRWPKEAISMQGLAFSPCILS